MPEWQHARSGNRARTSTQLAAHETAITFYAVRDVSPVLNSPKRFSRVQDYILTVMLTGETPEENTNLNLVRVLRWLTVGSVHFGLNYPLIWLVLLLALIT